MFIFYLASLLPQKRLAKPFLDHLDDKRQGEVLRDIEQAGHPGQAS